MSFFRSPAALRSLSRRSPLTMRQSTRPLSNSSILRSTQGYGDMQGNPESEDPQNQGGSSAKKQNAEHPGPAPPAEGQGSGAGPTKGGSAEQKTPEDASAASGGSRSKEAKETGSSPTGGKVGGGGKRHYSTQREGSDQAARREETMERAQQSEKSKPDSKPTIISNSDPAEGMSAEKKKEVEQHNKEFEERYDRAQPATDDKVDKKFWKGESFTLFSLC